MKGKDYCYQIFLFVFFLVILVDLLTFLLPCYYCRCEEELILILDSKSININSGAVDSHKHLANCGSIESKC